MGLDPLDYADEWRLSSVHVLVVLSHQPTTDRHSSLRSRAPSPAARYHQACMRTQHHLHIDTPSRSGLTLVQLAPSFHPLIKFHGGCPAIWSQKVTIDPSMKIVVPRQNDDSSMNSSMHMRGVSPPSALCRWPYLPAGARGGGAPGVHAHVLSSVRNDYTWAYSGHSQSCHCSIGCPCAPSLSEKRIAACPSAPGSICHSIASAEYLIAPWARSSTIRVPIPLLRCFGDTTSP